MIPGAALRKLTAITGLEATCEADGVFRLEVSPAVALFSFKREEVEACRELREMNLKRVNRLVFEKQQWRCARCGERLPLSGHHKVFRSRWRRAMGPLDTVENIEGLCARDHETEHT